MVKVAQSLLKTKTLCGIKIHPKLRILYVQTSVYHYTPDGQYTSFKDVGRNGGMVPRSIQFQSIVLRVSLKLVISLDDVSKGYQMSYFNQLPNVYVSEGITATGNSSIVL